MTRATERQPDPEAVTDVGRARRTESSDANWIDASGKYLVEQASHIRDAAAKWGQSATAILAVAGLATAFEGRETLAELAPAWRDPVTLAVLAAITLSGLALLTAAIATSGSASVTWDDPGSFRSSQAKAAADAATWLDRSKWLVVGALIVSVVAVGMIWTVAKAPASADSTLVVGAQGEFICGELTVSAGRIVVDGQPLPAGPISVHSVPDCPK